MQFREKPTSGPLAWSLNGNRCGSIVAEARSAIPVMRKNHRKQFSKSRRPIFARFLMYRRRRAARAGRCVRTNAAGNSRSPVARLRSRVTLALCYAKNGRDRPILPQQSRATTTTTRWEGRDQRISLKLKSVGGVVRRFAVQRHASGEDCWK